MKAGKNIPKKIIVHDPKCKKQADKLRILRIQILPEHTKVDFGYLAMNHYIRGGWVQIYENTFIRDCKTGKDYKFIKADNIPMAPQKHFFTSNFDHLYYSLYFEPIPADAEKIDIIERENDDSTFFNFYRVDLGKAEKDEVL